LEPDENNPLGYDENEGFLKIDDALLAHFGGSWNNPPLLNSGWEWYPSLGEIFHEARSVQNTFSKNSNRGRADQEQPFLFRFRNYSFLICDL